MSCLFLDPAAGGAGITSAPVSDRGSGDARGAFVALHFSVVTTLCVPA